jgi:hypothetical protein
MSDSQEAPRTGTGKPWLTPVVTGVLGLFGAWLGTTLQTRGDLDLERERLRSQLILKAIETGDPKRAAVNLKFLVDVGLVTDTTHRLVSYVTDSSAAPALPASSPQPSASLPERGLSSGDRVSVTLHLPFRAEVSYYHRSSKQQVEHLGVMQGDTTISIVGGYLFFEARNIATGEVVKTEAGCPSGCSVSF